MLICALVLFGVKTFANKHEDFSLTPSSKGQNRRGSPKPTHKRFRDSDDEDEDEASRPLIRTGPTTKYERVTIMDIQGNSHFSPYSQKFVQTQGVVTQVLNLKQWNGFFMQMDTKKYKSVISNRGAKSTGIYVQYDKKVVEVGDVVEVEGMVYEKHLRHFFEEGELGLTMTTMSCHHINKIGEAEFKAVDAYTVDTPTEIIYMANQYESPEAGLKALDIKRGMDWWEHLEGMYVKITKPIVAQGMKYGNVYVYAKDFVTNTNMAGGLTSVEIDGVIDMQPELIALFTKEVQPRGSFNAFKVGDELNDIYGTVIYERGIFGIYIDGGVSVKKSVVHTKTALEPTSDFRIASYNVLNLAMDSKHVDGIASHILRQLGTPSVVGLVEIVDDQIHSGESDRLLKYLCSWLNKRQQTVLYKYTYIKAEDEQDGGKPGNNIKQAILYDSNLFEDVPSRGDHLDSCDVEFTKNPCRVDPTNESFNLSRKPLAAQFTFKKTKETIVIVVNHFKSLIGSSPLYGRIQPPVQGSAAIRDGQSKAVAAFVGGLEGHVICMGDFNDLPFSDTYKTIASKLIDTHSFLPKEERYSYIYQGQSQKIDYIFASESLMRYFKTSGILHLNSLYRDQVATSDHDPVYAEFEF